MNSDFYGDKHYTGDLLVSITSLATTLRDVSFKHPRSLAADREPPSMATDGRDYSGYNCLLKPFHKKGDWS